MHMCNIVISFCLPDWYHFSFSHMTWLMISKPSSRKVVTTRSCSFFHSLALPMFYSPLSFNSIKFAQDFLVERELCTVLQCVQTEQECSKRRSYDMQLKGCLKNSFPTNTHEYTNVYATYVPCHLPMIMESKWDNRWTPFDKIRTVTF